MKSIRRKSQLIIMGLIMSLFVGCVGVDPAGRGYSIAVPMGMINSTLANQFPIKESRSFGTVEMLNPNVLGQEGQDKLSVGTSFNITSMLMPNGIGGNLKLSSGVRFDPVSKNLYLANPMVEDLKFQDFSLAKYLTNDMRNALGLLIAETISKKPIYNISKAGMGTGFVKGIDVRNGQIFLTFGL
ncbi:MAG: Unknown protein [uncultured Sulfurovum sp.]|uniref:DUF1439 domain-containing protein n=1 Tax=uncultured Sulfurovum sp. TaxID=269237 RepID=A0A6S6S450_9BACT|nr:MAG: Unknown protein [uncultured Sulfurovum sp.]